MRRVVRMSAALAMTCVVATTSCAATGDADTATGAEASLRTTVSAATPPPAAGTGATAGSPGTTAPPSTRDAADLDAAGICGLVDAAAAEGALGHALIGVPTPEPADPPQCAWNFTAGGAETALNVMLVRPEDWKGYKGDLYDYVVDGYKGAGQPEALDGPWVRGAFIENDGSQTMVVDAGGRIFVLLAVDQPRVAVVAFAEALAANA